MVIKIATSDVHPDLVKTLDQYKTSHEIVWVTIPPNSGNNAWLFILDDGTPISWNCPTGAHQEIEALKASGGKAIQAAFTNQGAWAVLDNTGKVHYPGIAPTSFKQKVLDLEKNSVKVRAIAFAPKDIGWCIVTESGEPFAEWIAGSCLNWIKDRFNSGVQVRCVAFGPTGSQWVTIDSHDVWKSGNQNEMLQTNMLYQNQVYGPIQYVTFDPAGQGSVSAAKVTGYEKEYDPFTDTRVAVLDVYENVQEILKDTSVGYALTVGTSGIPGVFASGFARTSIDAPAQRFTHSTKTIIASCSKLITALAAIKVLDTDINKSVADYFPSGWKPDSFVKKMTFRQLLSHSAGIREFSGDNSFQGLKTFFTLDTTQNTQKFDPKGYGYDKKSWFYSNWNFSIMKIVLPIYAGTVKPNVTDDETYANAFTALVQKYVFDPIDCPGIRYESPSFPPQSETFAYTYNYPGNMKGFEYPPATAGVAAGGFLLTIVEAQRLLHSYLAKDNKVINTKWIMPMLNFGMNPMGWDNNESGNDTTEWIQKSGGSGPAPKTNASSGASLALFGKGLYGALFVNSKPITPLKWQTGWTICYGCSNVVYTMNGDAPCSEGGIHSTAAVDNFAIPCWNEVPPGAQKGWGFCKKCHGLFYMKNTTTAPCAGMGFHDFSTSGNYAVHFQPKQATLLPLEDPLYQYGWNFCKSCQGLANAQGRCPGPGGQHDFSQSGGYMLRRDMDLSADIILKSAYYRAVKNGT